MLESAGSLTPEKVGHGPGTAAVRVGEGLVVVSTEEALAQFSAAFGSGDVDAIMALMSDDVVFESTAPPDGERHEGSAAVRRVWEELFGGTPGARFEEEERFVAGDRGVLVWRFSWVGDDPGHVRGVDVVRFRDGKVTEKCSYVKG
jgi:ketosteroid isomerase-like protein